MKFLGFRVQVVVRYHGHHITNIRCRLNTWIHIGFLYEFVSFNVAVAEPSVGNVSVSSNVTVAEPSVCSVGSWTLGLV